MKITYLTSDIKIKDSVEKFIAEWKDIETNQLTVQTSGSTGKPKKITLEKQHMIESAKASCNFLNIQRDHKALLCLSPNTIGGLMMIVRSLVMDLDLIVGEVKSNPLENISVRINFIALVPLQLETILTESPEKIDLLENIIVGGGPISPALEEKIKSLKVNIFQTFGMTETISHFALRQIAPKNSAVFKCLPGATVSTKDEKLIVNFPEIGVNNLETNDLVELISSNQFKWIGRADFVINSGGIKIHPSVIEEQLDSIISVPFFSFGIPDERLGSKHILCVESNTDINLTKEVLVQTLERKIIPREIHYFERFEWTESGKINRPKTIKSGARVVRQVL